MEYQREEIDGPGSAPEFGAIFMSNIATKKECFRQNILALPFSKANFVKQVKEGMVLFLFEFEKRQLFGVYKATSDGGMNISPSPFIFSGRHFPAQVCFYPIWECSPLLENEFREAIRENYFTSKKFRFGLSEKQVRHLLVLFSSRKLPARQLSRIVTRPVGNDIRWADQDKCSIRERLKMEHCEDDFPPRGMSKFSPNSLHRAIEANDNMLFIDDRVENGKDINFIGDSFLTDQVGDSLGKRKELYDINADTGFYDTRTPLLSYRTDNHEVFMDKERVFVSRDWFPVAENAENNRNIYTGSPVVGTKYSKASLDLNRTADYERPDSESTNRHAIDKDRFIGNDTMKTKLNSHRTFRRDISDDLEDLLKRPGRTIDGFEVLTNRLGHNCSMDYDDVNPVFPSKNYDDFQHVVKGTSGGSRLLMDKRRGTEHNFELISEKCQNSFHSDQRIINERRFPLDSKRMKANCVGGIHNSTTTYEPSGHGTRIQRQVAGDYLFNENNGLDNTRDGGSFFNPVSNAALSNSLDCFNKASLDSHSFQQTGLQNIKTSNSTYHDSVVTRSISSASEHTTIHRHSSSTGVDRGAVANLRITPYDGCGRGLHNLSDRKSCEGEGCDRFDPAVFREIKDFHPASHDFIHPHTKVSQSLELRSSAPAVDMSLPFAPSTRGSVPFTEFGDLSSWRESLLAHENHNLPKGLQDHNQWQEIDQRIGGNEILSSSPKFLTNEELEHFKRYKTRISNDDAQHFNSGRVYSDSEMPRKSVFTRLTLGARSYIQEDNEKDDIFYLDASVDEVMDMLNSRQNIPQNSQTKFKPVVRQHGRDEMVRAEKQASPEHGKRFLTPQMENETSRVLAEDVNAIVKETREVGFKRRRDLKNGLDENGANNNVLMEENDISRENAESKGPVNKPGKRRKLVRPIFGNDASAGAFGRQMIGEARNV